MGRLKNMFESFFGSDYTSIDEHKKNILKEEANAHIVSGFTTLFNTIDTVHSGKTKDITPIMESMHTMVMGLDHFHNDKSLEIEKLLLEAIDSYDETTSEEDILAIEYLTVRLRESIELAGAKDVIALLESEFSNVERFEDSLEEEEDILNIDDGAVPPSDIDMQEIPTDTVQPADESGEFIDNQVVDEEQCPYERGFNEGRKYYKESRNSGEAPSPKNMARQLAETKYANKPYLEVEKWMEGFNQGIKFQERVLKETNPELFEDTTKEDC